ncbi:altered inheritance of mitochondria protein [Acrasis kona]|uniref:Altered inheritance of mitochondria protein n=1 Tax=Acrasis kona TaxID=1008807 RepID=A0AAW2YQD3_9EUKA
MPKRKRSDDEQARYKDVEPSGAYIAGYYAGILRRGAMNVQKLKEDCFMRGLGQTGKKDDLVARLQEFQRDVEKRHEENPVDYSQAKRIECSVIIERHKCKGKFSVTSDTTVYNFMEHMLVSIGFDFDHGFMIGKAPLFNTKITDSLKLSELDIVRWRCIQYFIRHGCQLDAVCSRSMT